MRKVVYTLNIGNYEPGITKMTYPLIEKWAQKIGARFEVITKRKFPDWPLDYEKFQLGELGKNNDWTIYVDSDTFIHPDMYDITNHIGKETVLIYNADMANVRFKYDKYFRRDKRNCGVPSWFMCTSDWTCQDFYNPVDDVTLDDILDQITPTNAELKSMGPVGTEGGTHLIMDYLLSRNVARFGLKVQLVKQMTETFFPSLAFMYHEYMISGEEKAKRMRETYERYDIQV